MAIFPGQLDKPLDLLPFVMKN